MRQMVYLYHISHLGILQTFRWLAEFSYCIGILLAPLRFHMLCLCICMCPLKKRKWLVTPTKLTRKEKEQCVLCVITFLWSSKSEIKTWMLLFKFEHSERQWQSLNDLTASYGFNSNISRHETWLSGSEATWTESVYSLDFLSMLENKFMMLYLQVFFF